MLVKSVTALSAKGAVLLRYLQNYNAYTVEAGKQGLKIKVSIFKTLTSLDPVRAALRMFGIPTLRSPWLGLLPSDDAAVSPFPLNPSLPPLSTACLSWPLVGGGGTLDEVAAVGGWPRAAAAAAAA